MYTPSEEDAPRMGRLYGGYVKANEVEWYMIPANMPVGAKVRVSGFVYTLSEDGNLYHFAEQE